MENKCFVCHQSVPEASDPPGLLLPAYHFILSCTHYANNNFFLLSPKFLIGPIVSLFSVNAKKAVLCQRCRRIYILSSVALYLLLIGGVVACLL